MLKSPVRHNIFFMLGFIFLSRLFLLGLTVLPVYASALPVIPDEIPIPRHIQKRSPEQIKAVFASLKKQHAQKTANLWRLNYHEALLLKNRDNDSFCRLMEELGDTPAFPLKDLAKIQSYEICPQPPSLKFDPDSVPEWLKLRLAEAFYKRRKTDFSQPAQTLRAVSYLGENSPYRDLRVSYLKHALVLAKEQEEAPGIQKIGSLLYKESPSLNPQSLPENYFSVAEDFRRNRKFKKALDFYIRVLNSKTAGFHQKDLSFKGLDRIYKIKRQRKEQIRNSRQWSQWLLNENTERSLKKYYRRRLELARQEWNLNENQKAIQFVTDILKNPKSESVSEEALYLRGLIYVQENQPELSLQDWNRAIKKLFKSRQNPKLLEKILWKKAWLLRRQKNYNLALDSFRSLEKINKNPYTGYKVLFWKGRTLQDLGHNLLARRNFQSLVRKDHFGYYGLMARKILNEKPTFRKQKPPPEGISFSKDKKAESLIHYLILFEEAELLSFFLDRQKSRFLNQKRQNLAGWLKMIWLWTKAKQYLELFRSLEQMGSKVKPLVLTKHLHFLFPMDFAKEVGEAGQKYNVPLALIFAIIRQESAFNVRARSPADAFGLMQIIPSTARQTARKFQIPYRNFRDLYRPKKNILLGTAYLQSLLKRYNNNFIFAVAAYNAGSTPLERWRKERPGEDLLEFIENIPYEETRTYVRLIIRNYVFYHNELGAEETWFPDWPLQ